MAEHLPVGASMNFRMGVDEFPPLQRGESPPPVQVTAITGEAPGEAPGGLPPFIPYQGTQPATGEESPPDSSSDIDWPDVGRGAATGISSGLGFAGGATAGASVGAFGGPVGAIAGGLVGGIGGAIGGGEIAEQIFGKTQTLAGKAVEAAAGAFAPNMAIMKLAQGGYRAGVFGENWLGRGIDGLMQMAKEKPVDFLKATAGQTAVAGGASLASRSVLPQDEFPVAQPFAELGLNFSVQGITSVTNAGIRAASQAWQSIKARMDAGTRAQHAVHAFFKESGDNPEHLPELYHFLIERHQALTGAPLSGLLGSQTLAKLERALVAENAELGIVLDERTAKTLATLRAMTLSLVDEQGMAALPAVLRASQAEAYATMLGVVRKVEQAGDALLDALVRNAPNRQVAGQNFKDALEDANQAAKQIQNKKWAEVDKHLPATMNNVAAEVREAIAQGGPIPGLTDGMPPSVKRFIEEAGDSGRERAILQAKMLSSGLLPAEIERYRELLKEIPLSSGDLMNLRSVLLEKIRTATANNDVRTARVLNGVQTALMDDLLETAAMARDPEAITNLTEAISTTKAYHDVFSRMFAGDVLAKKKSGAAAIPPEMLIKQLTAGGNEATNLRFRQLEDAARFVDVRSVTGLGNLTDFQGSVLDLEKKVLEGFLAATVKGESGLLKINRAEGARLLQEYDGLFGKFPNLRTKLQAAMANDIELKKLSGAVGKDISTTDLAGIQAAIETSTAMTAGQKLLLSQQIDELPESLRNKAVLDMALGKKADDVIGAALREGHDLGTIIGEITAHLGRTVDPRASIAASQGLSSALFSQAINKAMKKDNSIDFGVMTREIFEPGARGEKPVIDVMLEKGLVTEDASQKLKELMKVGEGIGDADATRGVAGAGGLPDEESVALQSGLKVAGSLVGSAVGKFMGAASLVMQGIFIRLFDKAFSDRLNNLFGTIPPSQILADMMANDPAAFIELLKPAPTAAQLDSRVKGFGTYLLTSGLIRIGGETARDE